MFSLDLTREEEQMRSWRTWKKLTRCSTGFLLLLDMDEVPPPASLQSYVAVWLISGQRRVCPEEGGCMCDFLSEFSLLPFLISGEEAEARLSARPRVEARSAGMCACEKRRLYSLPCEGALAKPGPELPGLVSTDFPFF